MMFLISKRFSNFLSCLYLSYCIFSCSFVVNSRKNCLKKVTHSKSSCLIGFKRVMTSVLFSLFCFDCLIFWISLLLFWAWILCNCCLYWSYVFWIDVGMLFVIESENDNVLMYATIGLINNIRASENPPTSLSHARKVPLTLSC